MQWETQQFSLQRKGREQSVKNAEKKYIQKIGLELFKEAIKALSNFPYGQSDPKLFCHRNSPCNGICSGEEKRMLCLAIIPVE